MNRTVLKLPGAGKAVCKNLQIRFNSGKFFIIDDEGKSHAADSIAGSIISSFGEDLDFAQNLGNNIIRSVVLDDGSLIKLHADNCIIFTAAHVFLKNSFERIIVEGTGFAVQIIRRIFQRKEHKKNNGRNSNAGNKNSRLNNLQTAKADPQGHSTENTDFLLAVSLLFEVAESLENRHGRINNDYGVNTVCHHAVRINSVFFYIVLHRSKDNCGKNNKVGTSNQGQLSF